MNALKILTRTMSVPRLLKKTDPCEWQYHPRSDHHSKIACWGVLFDLLCASETMRQHAAAGKIAFGINHTMVDHTNARKKNLDLVICRPSVESTAISRGPKNFQELGRKYKVVLTAEEDEMLSNLPSLQIRPVGSVLLALEAKAAMTEFGKARPRLYDELASSHVVVHGDTDSAIAVGLAMINAESQFLSPTKNPCLKWGAPQLVSKHDQPKELGLTIGRLAQLPRRQGLGSPGFDAICAFAVECRNDGVSAVELRESVPAPQPGDPLHYNTLVNRVVGMYQSRFPNG